MLVADYMTRHPITIEPHKKVLEARKIMMDSAIRHLPVVGDGKRLLGLITRERLQIRPESLLSLNVWEINDYLAGLTVEKVMIKGLDLVTTSVDATLEDAADLLIRNKVGALPVVQDGVVTGIITETDLLIELKELLGAFETGWRVTVQVPNARGEFSKLTGALAAKGWGIMAMGSVRSPKQSDRWDIVLKVRGCEREELVEVLKSISGQQLLDIRVAAVYPG